MESKFQSIIINYYLPAISELSRINNELFAIDTNEEEFDIGYSFGNKNLKMLQLVLHRKMDRRNVRLSNRNIEIPKECPICMKGTFSSNFLVKHHIATKHKIKPIPEYFVNMNIICTRLNCTEFVLSKYTKYQKMVKKCTNNKSQSSGNDYTFSDNTLYKIVKCKNEANPVSRIYLPRVNIALEEAHDAATSANEGISKTIHRLQQYYYWPRMYEDT